MSSIDTFNKPNRQESEKPAGTYRENIAGEHCGALHLGTERERLSGLIDKFAAGGAAGCTKNPHSFFGRLTPEEWAILMYKHLDHHLRQFGV